jgi:hypothetical protein
MVAERQDFPGENVRRQHLAFTHTFWQLLAYEAYRRFLSEGRGILLVREEAFLNKNLSDISGTEVGYVTTPTPEYEKILSEQETGWLVSYNPETLMLIAFLRTDNGISSYCLGGRPGQSPKEIYDRMKK